jgi:hypothetical protein
MFKERAGSGGLSAFKSVIGTLKKSGGDVLEKLTGLIGLSSPTAEPLQQLLPEIPKATNLTASISLAGRKRFNR